MLLGVIESPFILSHNLVENQPIILIFFGTQDRERNVISKSPGQNATGQNATGQNAPSQNATNSGICFYFLQMLFQFVALQFNMSQPPVISAYHKLCFAHTTLITGTPRHEH